MSTVSAYSFNQPNAMDFLNWKVDRLYKELIISISKK